MIYVTNQLGKKYSFEEYKRILMKGENDVVFNFPCPRAEVREGIKVLVLINKENPEECLVVGVKLVVREKCYLESKSFIDYSDDRKNTAYFLCSCGTIGYLSFGALRDKVRKSAKEVIYSYKRFVLV